MDIESAKLLGAGIAVLGVIGSGIGIGSIFAAFISAVGRNPASAAGFDHEKPRDRPPGTL